MVLRDIEEAGDRLIIRFEPNGPVELDDLSGGLAAIARLYARHYRQSDDKTPAPRLFVTRLQTGSIIAEVAPYAMLLGQAVYFADQSMIVSDFTRRIAAGLKAFSDPGGISAPVEVPSMEDASDLKEFIRPLAGRRGASLGVKAARFHQRDGDREVFAEYEFDEAAINRATVNMENALATQDLPTVAPSEDIVQEGGLIREVMLFLEQASVQPGRERGRTADKGVIPQVCEKALPVYFRKSFQNLKDKMVRGALNPLTNAFIVDVHVQRVEGEPRGYIVAAVHEIIPR
jgi:hypothetical protein